MRYAIIIENVSYSIDGKYLLKDINEAIPYGISYGFLGAVGSGKSTLLKICVGLLKPDKGRVVTLGVDVTSAKKREMIKLYKKIGYVFQQGGLISNISVLENLSMLITYHHGLRTKKAREKALEYLRNYGVVHLADLRPPQLSMGQKKIIAFIKATIFDPELIILDEPLSGLDPLYASKLEDRIKMLKNAGKTIVMVSHRMEFLKGFVDQISVLWEGKIIGRGSYKELIESKDPQIREFLGG